MVGPVRGHRVPAWLGCMLRGSTSWRPTMPTSKCASWASTRTCRTRPRRSPRMPREHSHHLPRAEGCRTTWWPTSSPPSARRKCSCWTRSAWCAIAGASTINTSPACRKPKTRAAIWPIAIDELLAGKEVSQPEVAGRRLLHRPRARADRRRRHLLESDRAHLSGSLRRVPSRGRDRPVLADQLRRSGRLGRNDSRSGRRGAHAALVCRSGYRPLRERRPHDRRREAIGSPMGRRRLSRGRSGATCPSRGSLPTAGTFPSRSWC